MAYWILHVDLDQFVAAVEILRRPELRGRPVVVGGDGDPAKRGVVSTASYEARALGVHSGLPLRTAAKRAPDAVFLPVDADAYEEASRQVMAVLRDGDAVVQVMGWDEAFLGIDTDDPIGAARAIQHRILAATDLHSTVGIGQTMLHAKTATGFGKPAGVFQITHETWFAVMGDRPTDALWGIGSRTAQRLAALRIETVRDLASTDATWLGLHVGPATGPWLVRLGLGGDPSPVSDEPWIARSRSRETTFQQDIEDWDRVRAEIVTLAHRVAADISTDGRAVVRVVVKVRFAPFYTHTRGYAVSPPSATADAIAAAALSAVDKFPDRKPVRLLGVRAEFA